MATAGSKTTVLLIYFLVLIQYGQCGPQQRGLRNDVEAQNSFLPTESPRPSPSPSKTPSSFPTISLSPSMFPSISIRPSTNPTAWPTATHSIVPTESPKPSPSPSHDPSTMPSVIPSTVPSSLPSLSQIPSQTPSNAPSKMPSDSPSTVPSGMPSTSQIPSTLPSMTSLPSSIPSFMPSTDTIIMSTILNVSLPITNDNNGTMDTDLFEDITHYFIMKNLPPGSQVDVIVSFVKVTSYNITNWQDVIAWLSSNNDTTTTTTTTTISGRDAYQASNNSNTNSSDSSDSAKSSNNTNSSGSDVAQSSNTITNNSIVTVFFNVTSVVGPRPLPENFSYPFHVCYGFKNNLDAFLALWNYGNGINTDKIGIVVAGSDSNDEKSERRNEILIGFFSAFLILLCLLCCCLVFGERRRRQEERAKDHQMENIEEDNETAHRLGIARLAVDDLKKDGDNDELTDTWGELTVEDFIDPTKVSRVTYAAKCNVHGCGSATCTTCESVKRNPVKFIRISSNISWSRKLANLLTPRSKKEES